MTRFSNFSSLVVYFNTFGLFEKLCRLNSFMACFVFLLHCCTLMDALSTRERELHKPYFGRDAFLKGSFACIAFERGALFQGVLLNFVIDFYLVTWLMLSPFCFSFRNHVILSQSRWAVALVSSDWDFASSGSFMPFHLTFGSFGRSSVHFCF